MNNRRLVQIIAFILVILLILGIYVLKNGGIGGYQESIDASFSSSRENIVPLEISGFTPAMITASEKPMILVLGESWCQPCLRMMDDLRELHRTVEDVEVRYIDLEKNPEAMSYFPVRVTPTIVLYLDEGVPYTPPEGFSISMLLYSSRDTGEHLFTVHEGYLSRGELDALIEALRDAR